MVNEILGALAGLSVGCVGYLVATLKASKKEAQHDRLYDNLHVKFTNLTNENVELQVDYKQLKADFEQLAEEHAVRKENNSILAADNNKIAKDYHELKKKYDELEERYAPIASLNPFEKQAVSAMTNQSILDEWLNGEKEVN